MKSREQEVNGAMFNYCMDNGQIISRYTDDEYEIHKWIRQIELGKGHEYIKFIDDKDTLRYINPLKVSSVYANKVKGVKVNDSNV